MIAEVLWLRTWSLLFLLNLNIVSVILTNENL